MPNMVDNYYEDKCDNIVFLQNYAPNCKFYIMYSFIIQSNKIAYHYYS